MNYDGHKECYVGKKTHVEVSFAGLSGFHIHSNQICKKMQLLYFIEWIPFVSEVWPPSQQKGITLLIYGISAFFGLINHFFKNSLSVKYLVGSKLNLPVCFPCLFSKMTPGSGTADFVSQISLNFCPPLCDVDEGQQVWPLSVDQLVWLRCGLWDPSL